MAKAFASQGGMTQKETSVAEIAEVAGGHSTMTIIAKARAAMALRRQNERDSDVQRFPCSSKTMKPSPAKPRSKDR
ncbi:hypothetical protein I5535_02305 [Rhodobacteraceae bacterium F11138]|nr:hypothetical protein [Rhodobacteraceae bacterium F11138]